MSAERQPEVLGHADEYDGIEEYDNQLPAWWLGIFYFSVVWGIGYAFHYHFVAQTSQAKAYEAEVAAAEARWPAPEAPTEIVATAEAIEAGSGLYTANCLACHGPELEGGIGPDLTDDVWIRGEGTPADIAEIITNGSVEKGMVAWGPILGTDKVSQLAAFISSKHVGGGSATPAGDGSAEAPSDGDAAGDAAMADAVHVNTQTATPDAAPDPAVVYQTNCVACHGPDLKSGEGMLGPNLLDDQWITGDGSLEAIEKTIAEGSPAKGMPAWGPILGEETVQEMAQFVLEKKDGGS